MRVLRVRVGNIITDCGERLQSLEFTQHVEHPNSEWVWQVTLAALTAAFARQGVDVEMVLEPEKQS